MRFGIRCKWSKQGDEIKHEIYLIDKTYDEVNRHSLAILEPEMSNIKNVVAANTELVEELLTHLVKKNMIEQEEAEKIRASATERIWEREREFYRVGDLDKYSE